MGLLSPGSLALSLPNGPVIWIGFGMLFLVLAAWRVRDRAQVRRHRQLELAVRQRTEQLERGQLLEARRNRILEMLVSNEAIETLLEAVARLTSDQFLGAFCVLLVRSDALAPAHPEASGGPDSLSASFRVGTSLVLPDDPAPLEWLRALCQRGALPFEIWREPCEHHAIATLPAWKEFVALLHAGRCRFPVSLRSFPIGDPGSPRGLIVLFDSVRASAAGDGDSILRGAARLAQIAIEHRRFCDELDFRAHHDTLTGLPNRSLLDERLELSLLSAQAHQLQVALIYVDVDEFKRVNDCMGHRTGDCLLTEVAARIRSVLRPGDTVARIGGDEFNILLPDVESAATATDLAGRIVEAVRQPVLLAGREVTVTVSAGIAVYPDDGRNAADLQREADAAMYYAKSLGKNRIQTFSDNAATLDSVRMEQALRQALEDNWFTVYYQPKFTAEGALAGLEALIRLNHPVHGQILPGRFIAIAERSGLIVQIGAWVLNEVCRQLAEWRVRNRAPVVVAVNVSALQIACADFADSVKQCLAAHRVPAHCLELEVTESMVVDQESEALRQMRLLRAHGVFISIDDFGTGFSSLSYLNRLQIDAVKLDRSFVQSIDTDTGAQHVVRAMISAAQGLGLDVIAEGVETEAQRVQLIAAGCPVMQGYLFAYPGPPETIEALITKDAASTTSDLTRLYNSLDAVPAVNV